MKEAGQVLGITESRVSQRLIALGKRVRQRMTKEELMNQLHVEPVTGQATSGPPTVVMETRHCAKPGCPVSFRVMSSSTQRYCSAVCHPDGDGPVFGRAQARKRDQEDEDAELGRSSGLPCAPARTLNPNGEKRPSIYDPRPEASPVASVMTHEEVEKRNEEVVKVNTSGMLTAKELADELGITPVTVYKWAKNDRIPYHRESERKTLFDLAEVKRALGREKEQDEVPEAPAPKPKKERASQSRADRLRAKAAADEGNSLEAIKVAAMKRAMLSYRKAIFHAAETAETEGNHELQAGLLKEYIAAGKDIAVRFAR